MSGCLQSAAVQRPGRGGGDGICLQNEHGVASIRGKHLWHNPFALSSGVVHATHHKLRACWHAEHLGALASSLMAPLSAQFRRRVHGRHTP